MASVIAIALLMLSFSMASSAETYHLSYDKLVLLSSESESNFPETLLRDVATTIGTNFIEDGLGMEEANELAFDVDCFTVKRSPITKCLTDYVSDGFTFSTVVSLHVEIDESSEDVNKELTILRVEATLSAMEEIARDVLINAVPILDKSIGGSNSPNSFWNIVKRPNLMELKSGSYSIPGEASIDKRVLSSPDKPSRVRPVSLRNPSSPSIDIWSYREMTNTHETTHDLFINSTLRATTNVASQAHAEAMVHPAVIAHPYPNRVAIISEAPLALIKELKKYYSNGWFLDITVVGTDLKTLNITRRLMPFLDDCSNLSHADDSCLDSAGVTILEQNVDEWLDSCIDEINDDDYGGCIEDDEYSEHYHCAPSPLFDVLFLDISPDKKQYWLSHDFHKKLQQLLNYESILVINDGSTPSMDFDFSVGSDNIDRDTFLTKATIDESDGGIGYEYVFVYDEVSEVESAFDASFTFRALTAPI